MPSKTVPDQTMSVREILERHARGLPTGGQKIPVYTETEDSDGSEALPNLKYMDLAEREEIIDRYREEKEQIEERIKKAKEHAKAKSKQKQESANASQQNQNTDKGTTQQAVDTTESL